MGTDYEQQPETGMKASAKYLLYLLIICLAGCAAFDVNLHEMLEARGFLTKILFSVPRAAWIVSATALQAYFLVLTKKRLPASPVISNIWTAIIALVVISGGLSLFSSDSNILSAIEIIASFLTAILMIVVGLKIRVSTIRPIANLGNVLVWMPIVLLLVVVAFFSLRPDDFGQIQQRVSNDVTGYRIITESYSESTIIYAVVFLIVNVLCEAIIYGAMALVISMPEESEADIEPMATEEIPSEEEPAEADTPVSEEPENRPSRKILWICGIALAVAVGATALVFTNKANSENVDDATFLRSLNDEEGIFYLNIDDPDSNIILTRPDTLTSEVEVYLCVVDGCVEGNWPGMVENGFVRSTDQQINTTLKVVSLHHLIMEENGKKTDLYSQRYLENEGNKVPIKKYGELEVQLFTADGHKFAKTNLYEMLPLDDNNTAHTIGWFPDSEEGQECTIKFNDDSVTISYGKDREIVYRLTGQADVVDVVIGHTYTNPDFGLEWTFINKSEGRVRFSDNSVQKFKWGEGNPGTIVIYGDDGSIVSGAEIHQHGNSLTVTDFSDGSEFKMTQTK